MAQQSMYIPTRIDFPCYITSAGTPFSNLLTRILDDADATLPSLGAPQLFGAAETYYLVDPAQRRQLGLAFAGAAANPRLASKFLDRRNTPSGRSVPVRD